MKPGSWLEFSQYDPQKAKDIYSHGFVETFIVRESLNYSLPEFPFIVLIDHPDEILKSSWKLSSQFRGFLWRTHVITQTQSLPSAENVWIDFIIDDFKEAQAFFQKISDWPIKGYFISTSEKTSARKINSFLKKQGIDASSRPYDLSDSSYNEWEALETFEKPEFEFNLQPNPKLSIIIPHHETPFFVCNVLKHLQKATATSVPFEVLVIDDGSKPKSFHHVCHFAHRHLPSLSLKILRWKKDQLLNTGEKVFRAGASRNWGATLARSENLFFLDADMLTPSSIIDEILSSLKDHDVVQFVRKHIPSELSCETIAYDKLLSSPELYIEESSYWRTLFESRNWNTLPDFWKYTCTYSLALKKKTFFDVGRIRRNFIRYGFEDTDLGYRLFKAGCTFKLNSTPLLHLTSIPDQSQGLLFKINKLNRISPMAKAFYKLNLDPEIYNKFQSLLD